MAPQPESVQQVEDWLASHGHAGDALSRSSAGDWITVQVAETMLDAVRSTPRCTGYLTLIPCLDVLSLDSLC